MKVRSSPSAGLGRLKPQLRTYRREILDEIIMKHNQEMMQQMLARQTELEQEVAELRAKEQETRQITEMVQAAALALIQSLNLETVLETLLDYLAKLVPYDSASVLLLDDQRHLVNRAIRGYEQWTNPALVRATVFDIDNHNNLQRVLENNHSLLIDDTQEDPTWYVYPVTAYIRNWLGVPLCFGDNKLGLFSLDKATPNFFTAKHVTFAEMLAVYAAIAIENVQLYRTAQHESSKRQQMEATSQESERKYRDLVQNANSVILEWDKNGIITFINKFGLEFFGYQKEELIGQNVIGTIVPKTESSGRDLQYLIQDIVDNPEHYAHNENENITKSGERVWAVWSNTARFDQHGNFIGLLSIANDVTPQKLAEEAIHRQNEYLAALHETTLGLMSRLELNDLLQAIISRAGQLLGTSHGSIYLAEPEAEEIELVVGVGIFEAKVGSILKSGESMPGMVWQTGEPMVVNDYTTWPHRSPNFDYRDLRAGVGVPLTSGDKLVGVLGLGYSFETDKRLNDEAVKLLSRFAQLASIALDNAHLYAEAQEARRVAEMANDAKSTFLANVSHELRTPLTSVLGFTKIIQKRLEIILPQIDAPDRRTERAIQQVNQNIDIIIAEGERLTTLINDVLDLAKIEAGHVEWQMQSLRVSEIVNRASTATSALFEQKKLPLMQKIDPALPPIIGDSDRLIQVMINLFSNAVKFTDQGQVVCRAKQVDNQIIISVTDTGRGIAEGDQAKIFDKFKQVGDTLTDKPKGTGLGLPICKEIILNHQGTIWVDSQLGSGTTFSFSLPIADSY